MYRVLIADDDPVILENLKRNFCFEKYGFHLCGEASEGRTALKLIQELQPDLVLIDIRMPKLSGLDIMKLSREQGFSGFFILMSACSDFSYAQEAIRYGASAYLVKPLDMDELAESVLKVARFLEREENRNNSLRLLKKKAGNVVLHEILCGIDDTTALLSGDDLINMELAADSYQIVLYENFSPAQAEPSYSFADLLRVSNKDEQTFSHMEEDHKDVILLKGSYAQNRFQNFLQHYNADTPPQKGSPMDTLFLAYGRPVASLGDIHLSYEDARLLLTRRFFCGPEQHTMGYEELTGLQQATQSIQPGKLAEYTSLLVGYLQTFNRKNVTDILSDMENYLYHVADDISVIKLFLTDLYLQIKERINLVYHTLRIPFPSNSAVIAFIDEKHYMYEIIRFLSEQFEMIMNATGNPNRNSVLDDILYYIDHNYQTNIKLENIAPLFGYNSAYLGKIFSRTVGESFNSYVDHMRIRRAQELLLENRLKVYEIAEKVGYRNVDYFHKKFKKYVGVSPAEFRKKKRTAE